MLKVNRLSVHEPKVFFFFSVLTCLCLQPKGLFTQHNSNWGLGSQDTSIRKTWDVFSILNPPRTASERPGFLLTVHVTFFQFSSTNC